MQSPSKPASITIEQLYPNLPATELKAAEENLQAYLAVVLRIYQRLEREGNLDVLTKENPGNRFRAKVDFK